MGTQNPLECHTSHFKAGSLGTVAEHKCLEHVNQCHLSHFSEKTSFRESLDKSLKGTLPRKSTWALNVQFSEKTTMVPFIWM